MKKVKRNDGVNLNSNLSVRLLNLSLRSFVLSFFSCMCFISGNIWGQNLIKNGDFNKSPIYPICHLENTTNGHAKVSQQTDKKTGNKYVKMELLTIKNGKSVDAGLVFTKGSLGFKVKPNTTYKYSLKLKGESQGAILIYGLGWTSADRWKGRHKLQHTLKIKNLPTEWKSFEGTFKTLPNVKTATLLVQMWWNTKYGPMKFKVGDYILVDDVIVEEVH